MGAFIPNFTDWSKRRRARWNVGSLFADGCYLAFRFPCYYLAYNYRTKVIFLLTTGHCNISLSPPSVFGPRSCSPLCRAGSGDVARVVHRHHRPAAAQRPWPATDRCAQQSLGCGWRQTGCDWAVPLSLLSLLILTSSLCAATKNSHTMSSVDKICPKCNRVHCVCPGPWAMTL